MRLPTLTVLGIVVASLGAAGVSHSEPPVPGLEAVSRIAWAPSFEMAQARARQEHKPILVLHLFGKLTEPFC